MKRNVLVNEYKDGGMKLTNVNMFLNSSKCGLVKRMLNTESNGCWKIVYDHILNRNAGKFVFECYLNTPNIQSICENNIFLRDIPISWNKVKWCDYNNKSHYSIWNNSGTMETNQDIGKNGMIKE